MGRAEHALGRSQLDRVFDFAQEADLKPCPIVFEEVPARLMEAVTAYGGLLNRYQHWTFGKAFQRIRLAHDFRLTRMYELVVNANPALAYLLDSNTPVENLVVTAHVIAHVDFFQQHYRFRGVPDNMPDRLGHITPAMERAREMLGPRQVEQWLEDAMVAAEMLDPYNPDWEAPANVLAFIQHAARDLPAPALRLIEWVQEEARYFRPQLDTKIANEGWATYWHQQIMRRYPLRPGEVLEYARLHAAVVGGGGLENPYRLGLAIWEYAFQEAGVDAFQAHRYLSDSGLVDRFLTPELLGRLEPGGSREELLAFKAKLLQKLDNAGLPRIEVEGVEQGTLVLRHRHDGRDLDQRQLPGAMKALARLWSGPVRLLTSLQGTSRRILARGEEIVEEP
jgi:stage V sporulation protein R